ncbi:hypothetical protein [Paenibacillus dakarensis]|uniref:hypothetical protein n=1 Tax=Paenibacillus dakarensis TaxID=1527293 RepID=UPI0006D531A1|nr:hypothetical protein [Paenibacillus dakarensis]
MIARKFLHRSSAQLFTVFLAVLWLSGCSIPSRVLPETQETVQPAAPVLRDVYERSVNKDVYSRDSRRGESILPEPSMLQEAPIRDSTQ